MDIGRDMSIASILTSTSLILMHFAAKLTCMNMFLHADITFNNNLIFVNKLHIPVNEGILLLVWFSPESLTNDRAKFICSCPGPAVETVCKDLDFFLYSSRLVHFMLVVSCYKECPNVWCIWAEVYLPVQLSHELIKRFSFCIFDLQDKHEVTATDALQCDSQLIKFITVCLCLENHITM